LDRKTKKGSAKKACSWDEALLVIYSKREANRLQRGIWMKEKLLTKEARKKRNRVSA